jgi:hypothetical protein
MAHDATFIAARERCGQPWHARRLELTPQVHGVDGLALKLQVVEQLRFVPIQMLDHLKSNTSPHLHRIEMRGDAMGSGRGQGPHTDSAAYFHVT